MGISIGNSHKLPPSSTGAMFPSPLNMPDRERCRPATLLNIDICGLWLDPDIQAGGTPILIACNSNIFSFSILWHAIHHLHLHQCMKTSQPTTEFESSSRIQQPPFNILSFRPSPTQSFVLPNHHYHHRSRRSFRDAVYLISPPSSSHATGFSPIGGFLCT